MRKTKVGLVMLVEIISLVLAILLMSGVLHGNIGGIIYMLDLPALLILLLLVVPVLFANGLAGSFVNLFRKNKDKEESLGDLKKSLLAVELLQKQFIYAGLMVIAFELSTILRQLDEPAVLGLNLSVVLIMVLYVGILELLLMPLKIAVQKRITEYIEEDI